MKLDKDLREFVALLIAEGVEFLVVGGHALAFHGYPRYTGDIDFWIRPDRENASKILTVVESFGFGNLGLSDEAFLGPDKVLQLGYPPNRIDLMTSISGVEFSQAWDGRVSGELDGLPVSFLGREAMLRNKRASRRTKDLADLEALLLQSPK